MIAALRSRARTQVAADPSVRSVVDRGRGRGFLPPDTTSRRAARTPRPRSGSGSCFGACDELMLLLTRLPQPVIARVHGIATAAGLPAGVDVRSRRGRRYSALRAARRQRRRFLHDTGGRRGAAYVAQARNGAACSPARRSTRRLALAWAWSTAWCRCAELDAAVAHFTGIIGARSRASSRRVSRAFYRQVDLGSRRPTTSPGAMMACSLPRARRVRGHRRVHRKARRNGAMSRRPSTRHCQRAARSGIIARRKGEASGSISALWHGMADDIILETRGLDQGVQGLRRASTTSTCTCRRGTHPCADRPERRGQDDLLQPAHALPDADPRRDLSSTAREITGSRPSAIARMGHGPLVPDLRGVPAPHGALENVRIALQRKRGHSFDFWRSERDAGRARRARARAARRGRARRLRTSDGGGDCPTAASVRSRSPPRSRSTRR